MFELNDKIEIENRYLKLANQQSFSSMHLGPEAERIVLPILQQNQISEIVFTKYQK